VNALRRSVAPNNTASIDCAAGRFSRRPYNASPRKSFGHFANEPGGLTDKKLLQRWQTIDKTEAHVANEAQHVRLVGEQPVEPIGRNAMATVSKRRQR